MSEFFLYAMSALWLGILTSISPCPLATNITAMSFVSRRVSEMKTVLLAGLLYTLGRMLTYVVLGVILVSSAQAIPEVSYALQKYMNKVLGPVLILVGMILLELININFSGTGVSGKMQKRVEKMNVWGAGFLGIIFALSFCPLSAALFFGSLIPIAVASGSSLVMPAFYGLGTGLPVFLFALLIAFGTQQVGKMFNKLTVIERWVRRVTGGVFIGVGVYYSLAYIFQIF